MENTTMYDICSTIQKTLEWKKEADKFYNRAKYHKTRGDVCAFIFKNTKIRLFGEQALEDNTKALNLIRLANVIQNESTRTLRDVQEQLNALN